MKNKKHWDTVIELSDGWSIRNVEGGYWYVYTPEGCSVRYPAFLTKEGALAGWESDRKRHETENAMISRCMRAK